MTTPASDRAAESPDELVRGLGLFDALTIGMGTMIGAGIFVLPGLIVEKAGPAAVISFALGGLIALFNAVSAAELATGMPRSGGAYYFASRALGPTVGAVIGWGAWTGLVFATAFYAMGFGEYLAPHLGLDPGLSGAAMIVLLVGLNLVGSRHAARAQNLIVGVLLAVLVLFLVYGLGEAEPARPFEGAGFVPHGWLAVGAGTATLFVTYCGFAGIASVAEEIRDPSRNLPRALIGSVVAVTGIYCLVLLVCVMAHPAEDLSGTTVVSDLAEEWMGPVGTTVILAGAVLAMVSSANASIMSASRISFAMGRDDMVWPWLNQIHPRFRVPHRAIVVTGGLVLAVLLIGEIELLAEVAGLMHLLMYGLMSLACIVLRQAEPLQYRPTFRAPFGVTIPLLGAAGAFVVAAFLPWHVLLIGVGLIVLSLLHFRYWSSRRTPVRGAWPRWLERRVIRPLSAAVERHGRESQRRATILSAIRNPDTERARLRLAAALLQDRPGRIVGLSVFRVGDESTLDDDELASYRRTLHEREQSLREQTEELRTESIEVSSMVPLAVSILPAMLGALEVSEADLLLVGWPAPHGERPARIGLLREVARHATIPIAVLREAGELPPSEVLLVGREDDFDDVSLGFTARLATGWLLPVTAVVFVPEQRVPETDEEDREEHLEAVRVQVEERLLDVVRGEARVEVGDSLEAVLRRVDVATSLVVLRDDGSLDDFERRIETLPADLAASLLLLHVGERADASVWT